jgi:A/G-specific adenine glycosylase
MDFAKKLIDWYHVNKRDLPWRNTKNPYKIWLSEIILQQTRVEQGMPYYLKILKAFPTIHDLANAPIDNVLKLWQGLGYYSRARNLHTAAKTISQDFKGQFPDNYNDLKKLKGIGDYTAAAIASFSFNKAHAVLDGNVFRVLSRYYNIDVPIDSSSGKKIFSQLANDLMDKKDPSTYNQAIMEFGAMHCKPQAPDCFQCVFSEDCLANRLKSVINLPVKEKTTKIKDRYFYYLVIKHKGNFFLKKREEKDIWQGLFEFPLVELPKRTAFKKVIQSKAFSDIVSKPYELIHVSDEFLHVLSHQRIHAVFIHIQVTSLPISHSFEKTNVKNLTQYPISRLVEKYLNKNNYFSD